MKKKAKKRIKNKIGISLFLNKLFLNNVKRYKKIGP